MTKDSSTKRLRDSHKQSKTRKKSNAKNKKEKHVGHVLDLEVAKYISQKSKGKENTKKLKKALNDKSNLKMVDKNVNLVKHREIAISLKEKYESGKTLTKKEEDRAKSQVKVIQENQKILPKGFLEGSIGFYKKLKTKSGKTLIDKRKIKKK
jgi:hypothetical protein